VGLVPLPEGSSIDLDDGRLDEGVGSDKLVVGSVVRLENTDRSNISIVLNVKSKGEGGREYSRHRRSWSSWCSARKPRQSFQSPTSRPCT
jgi:hypothetical protein